VGTQEELKVEPVKMNETLMLNINSAATVGIVIGFKKNNIICKLKIPVCPEIKNLGKLLIAEQIKSAINYNCNKIDFMSTESGWKKLWNLDSEQMYEFVK